MIKFFLKIIKPYRFLFDQFTYQRSSYPKELLKLKGSLKNKPLLVVGNGPSLNKTPLEKFKHIHSIGMNKIDLIFKKTSWRPTYIIVSNTLVIRQNYKKFNFPEIKYLLSWKARWLIPFKVRKFFDYFLEIKSDNFEKNFTSGISALGTVTNSALQFAFFLEANPIVIVGVDHHFFYKGNPNEYKKMDDLDINHFDLNYFSKNQYWGLPNLDKSEKAFKNAKKAFQNCNRKIFDATINGKLNVFDKISIEEALDIINQ